MCTWRCILGTKICDIIGYICMFSANRYVVGLWTSACLDTCTFDRVHRPKSTRYVNTNLSFCAQVTVCTDIRRTYVAYVFFQPSCIHDHTWKHCPSNPKRTLDQNIPPNHHKLINCFVKTIATWVFSCLNDITYIGELSRALLIYTPWINGETAAQRDANICMCQALLGSFLVLFLGTWSFNIF